MDTHPNASHPPQNPGRAACHGGRLRHMQGDGMGLRSHLTSNSLWEFAALAHELKQPLAAILSNAQAAWRLLAMDPPELTEVHAALADIIADTRRTDEVLRRLQAFVTTGELQQVRLNINDVIHDAIGLVHSDATAQNVIITLDLAAALPLVYGDRVQLRQVLLNLVRNAFEAMQSVQDGDRTLAVRTASATMGIITVMVQDCGIGVDEASMARLFYPFFTTRVGGMGLGLALSRSIIAAHGGWIWATRNPDRGLTISFTLPAV